MESSGRVRESMLAVKERRESRGLGMCGGSAAGGEGVDEVEVIEKVDLSVAVDIG